MKAALVLTLITLLVPAKHQKHNDETEKAATTRYERIAEAISTESNDDKTLALFLLTVARHESTFRKDIHSGKQRGDAGHSWGLYQIRCGKDRNAFVPGTKYRAHQIVGIDLAATKRATHAAAIWLRPFIKKCKGNPMCVFKSYAGLSKTEDPKVKTRLKARVKTYRRLVYEAKKRDTQ